MKKEILFVSHDASVTGAPILLLRLIESLKEHSDFSVLILLRNGGSLEQSFNKHGDVFIWNRLFSGNFIIAFFQRFSHYFNKRKFLKRIKNTPIIFNNTVTNTSLLRQLSIADKRVFNYWHEMGILINKHTKIGDIEYMSSISEKIFVPAEAVKLLFMSDFKIPQEKIFRLNYIIPKPTVNRKIPSLDCKDKFVVGFAGSLYWRKGYEFLPLIVDKIINHLNVKDIVFIWLGADKSLLEYSIVVADLDKLNLKNYVSFVEPVLDIGQWLINLDVLVLPSREDAFPLVVLEAASLGVPSICFDKAGGISEFINDDAGIVVNYLDIDSMINSILSLKEDSNFKMKLGQTAKEKVRSYNGVEVVNQVIKYLS